MIELARSENPVLHTALQAAAALHPATADLSLHRIERLLDALGNPHHALPPVFHVAGTNGKGSTVAFIRACLEASGRRVHVYTSPHLVRINERIRLAGTLVEDAHLAALIHEVLHINAGAPITFFEVVTSAAFLAFVREPADAVVLEVGLGGRLDATNVVPAPLVCGIAQLGLDHQRFLGRSILDIAGEKASIAKPGRPIVLSRYPKTVAARIAEVAGVRGAHLVPRGIDWDAATYAAGLHYRDAEGVLSLPLPRLPGLHQHDNAALAVAMLRHQSELPVHESALRAGLGWAEWPARLQRLDTSSFAALLPPGSELWLDGGHNPAAARALAETFRALAPERDLHLVAGLLETKDAASFMKAFTGRAVAVHPVPVPDHASHAPAELAELARAAGIPALPAPSVAEALTAIGQRPSGSPPVVLIAGSLHLAGAVLAEIGWHPS